MIARTESKGLLATRRFRWMLCSTVPNAAYYCKPSDMNGEGRRCQLTYYLRMHLPFLPREGTCPSSLGSPHRECHSNPDPLCEARRG